MNTLTQIEQLLLPVWKQLINVDKRGIPKSFVKLITNIIPKYNNYNFDTFFGGIRKKLVINSLRRAQIDLIEIRALDKREQEGLNVLINKFERDSTDELEKTRELKSQETNVYEVGQLVGYGGYSYFFRLRNNQNLGVKIRREGNDLQQKKALEEEFKKAHILFKLGVSVPRYLSIVQVRFPLYFTKTIDKNKEVDKDVEINDYFKEQLKNFAGKTMFGLLIENVEQDLTLISSKRLKKMYEREMLKVGKLGIYNTDFTYKHNVLWSKRNAKLYVIDFDTWEIPKDLK